MTLVKTKRRQEPIEHRKRHGQHHQHTPHYLKTYWPYLPMTAIVSLGFMANSWLGTLHRSVLGYATDMSVTSLLADTNAQRAANGEPWLNLNNKLDAAAQAKANDMASRNYWSHNTPDGKTPWTFITAAGYQYQTAGENLAYGFATAGETVTGWMNSPEHRANILNTTYRDVGFGIVNIADYQNSGPETLVVAMYGSLPGEPANAVGKPAAAAPTGTPAAATPSSPAQATSLKPKTAAKSAAPKPAAVAVKPTSTDTLSPAHLGDATAEPASRPVARIQLLSASTSWSVLIVAAVGFLALAVTVLRHGFAWHRMLVRGERFVLRHPLLDLAAMTIVTMSIIASQSIGIIR